MARASASHRDAGTMAPGRRLAATAGRAAAALVPAGIACAAGGAIIIGLLHLVPPTATISPMRRTISEYGLTDLAWAFNAGVLALAVGSAAILTAVALFRPGTRAGLVAGALWVFGLLTVVAFPKHNWAVGPSVSGQVHRIGSLIAFIALPLAVLALTGRRMRRGRPGAAAAGWAFGLALVSLAWFLPIVAAIASAGRGGAWWLAIPLGLVERGMAVTEVLALIALGRWCLRAAGGNRSPAAVSADAPAVTGDPAQPVTGARAIAVTGNPAGPVTDATTPAVTGDPAAPVTDPAVP
jgi:hypothetical protein